MLHLDPISISVKINLIVVGEETTRFSAAPSLTVGPKLKMLQGSLFLIEFG